MSKLLDFEFLGDLQDSEKCVLCNFKGNQSRCDETHSLDWIGDTLGSFLCESCDWDCHQLLAKEKYLERLAGELGYKY